MIDKFRNASPSGQVAIALVALAALSLALTMSWLFLFRVEYRPVFTHLDAPEAAAIIAELDKRKIPYHLADGGATIAVPGEQADTVRVNLAGSAVGRQGTTGFELFDKSDMGITDFAQKINFQRALQGELERTIETLDGVKKARVHLSLGDDRLFREDRALPKASALIEMRDGAALTEQTVEGVRRLVAASVPSLEPSAVVVLDAKGHVVADSAVVGQGDVDLSPGGARRRAIQAMIAADVQQALAPAFGTDFFDVGVMIGASADSSLHDPSGPPFNMDQRDYPISVTLRPKREVADKVRDSARALVAKKVAMRLERGDSIIIEAPQAVPVIATPASPQPTPQSSLRNTVSPSQDKASREGPMTLLALGAGVLLGTAVILAMLRLKRRPDQALDRQHFASHLQTLIDKEGGL